MTQPGQTQQNFASTQISSWKDLLGECRRRAARERRSRLCDIGTPGPVWISEAVDADVLDVGYWCMSYVAPDGPPERDREALTALMALTALLDTCGTKMRDFDNLLDRVFRGQTVRKWILRAGHGVDQETAESLSEGFRIQMAQLAANRVEKILEHTSEQHRLNQADYGAYLNWRNREGAFNLCIGILAVAAGIDMRAIPKRWIDETIEASIISFDVHGALRHACEDEIGHVLNYLPGDQHAQVSDCLELITEITLSIQDELDLNNDVRAFLMRLIGCATAMCYSCRRYMTTTPLHIAQAGDVQIYWAQVNDSPHYRYTLTELQSLRKGDDDIQRAHGK